MASEVDRPLVDLAGRLRRGYLQLLDYLEALEARFKAREPQVLAFLPEEGRFDRMRREAQALEARHPDRVRRPPLYGIPVGVKDIFHLEGFVTRAGSRLPSELLTGEEGEGIRRLKEAGALVFGKTVTTEFAYFAPGPTRNPYNPEHTPGGSSSGSAAAVGARIVPLALGTQTIGSITRPAAFCGVVGYKPSYDRISRRGVIPLAPSLDHVGFFTLDVAGAALTAPSLVHDWRVVEPGRAPVLGVPEGPYLTHASEEGLAQFRDVEDRLVSAGYSVVPVDAMSDFEAIAERHNQILAVEAAQVHALWYAEFGERYHPKTVALIELARGVSAQVLAEALDGRLRLREELMTLMDECGIDLWISPAAPGPAPRGLESTGDPVMSLPWTHSGLPTVSLPSGFNPAGLPFGLQVAGSWHTDETLLAWAGELERALLQSAD